MKRAEKVARRNRRNRYRSRRKTKALMVAASCATAGTTLVAMAMSTTAWADYTSPNGFIYHPGLALQAGGSVAVTYEGNAGTPYGLWISGANSALPTGSLPDLITLYYGGGFQAIGTVPLFVDQQPSDGSPTIASDCAGGSITGSGTTFGGCSLKTYDSSGNLLDSVPVTVAFPIVTQSATPNTSLSNGSLVTVKTNAQGDPTYAANDSVVVEECPLMPAGFDVNQCIGLGTMSGSSGNYTATNLPVQTDVGSTVCAKHNDVVVPWNGQCSLWTVEVHNAPSGKYWWPLADGIPITFK